MLIAAIISGFLMGFSPARMLGEYGAHQLCAISLITISAMRDGTERLSGVDATLVSPLPPPACCIRSSARARCGSRADRSVTASTSCSATCRRSPPNSSGCRGADGRRQLSGGVMGNDITRSHSWSPHVTNWYGMKADPALRFLHSSCWRALSACW